MTPVEFWCRVLECAGLQHWLAWIVASSAFGALLAMFALGAGWVLRGWAVGR
jgi:hypothetical protein